MSKRCRMPADLRASDRIDGAALPRPALIAPRLLKDSIEPKLGILHCTDAGAKLEIIPVALTAHPTYKIIE